MFKNYLRVALRNIIKNPLYSTINVVGLAVGLAACLLISLFVRDELSYDEQWENSESLFRINTTLNIPGREPMATVVAAGPIKGALESYFSQDIKDVTRFSGMIPVIKYQGNAFTEEVHWTDPATAEMFDLKVIAGDLGLTLNDNASLAVDTSFAKKHFGTTDAIDRVVNVVLDDINRDFRIGAVFEDLPHNTVLKFQALAMIDESDWSGQPYLFDHWFSINNNVFFQLAESASIDSIRQRMDAFVDQSIPMSEGSLAEDGLTASDLIKISAQAITDIQLNPAGFGEMKPTGNKRTVSIFAVVAGLTLLIACINFMNLATSRSTQRAREVALRKVMGAQRSQLIVQFLGESVLLALIGLLLGVVLAELLLPLYSNFLGKELILSYTDGFTVGVLALLVIAIGVVGGIYPALVLSRFQPARVLKANKSAESEGSASLRNALVVLQFTVSIALIIATATVYAQMIYATSMDTGFRKEQLLAISGAERPGVANQQDSLLQELKMLPGVERVSIASEKPFSESENNLSVRIPESPEAGNILIGVVRTDYEFFSTMEAELAAGRDFNRDYALDQFPNTETLAEGEQARGNLLINETAVRRLGFGTPQDAVGRTVLMNLGEEDKEGLFTVVGVVKDMHLVSIRSIVRPELYHIARRPGRSILIRFSGDPRTLASSLENKWTAMFPDVPLTYEHSDEVALNAFTQERNTATMLGTFSALAVIIACLGLYGLASFTAERRTKEIGIRRVLGASVPNIVGLLLWQFSKPIILANAIAWPIAIWSMVTWLQGFPYRLDYWVLAPLCIAAGLIALLISWMTVGGNAARVARRNPIQALRYE
ncbi:FtsX-like permease family protein [Congregibacter variabilis]|uniref:FtsX-like permease family protein n=1 Tax=Congregibacter variabilis TaxID=3081200 RepID=A0ABZ0I5I2_9GAMM|nr:FtsX-like permease family protein [Congregibacter sp. IMCC43200]